MHSNPLQPGKQLDVPVVVHAGPADESMRQCLLTLNEWLIPLLTERLGSSLRHPIYWINPKRPTPGVEQLSWSLHFQTEVSGRSCHGELRAYVGLQEAHILRTMDGPHFRLVIPPAMRSM